MARSSRLEPHLTVDQLRARYRTCDDVDEARRWHLLWLVARGQTAVAAAATVGLHDRSARKILRRYNDGGPAAVADHRGAPTVQPRPALLDADARAALATALRAPPPDGGVWTGPKVARWLAARTGRAQVYPQRGWEALRALGFTLRRPRPRHAKADAAAQDAFKRGASRSKSRKSGARTPTR